jgi:tRNA threonylcarbamoyladenosine biosynthesis protein TsaB
VGLISEPALLLAIDTCGPTGSVALGQLAGAELHIADQIHIAGRIYSAELIPAVSEVLAKSNVQLANLSAIVVVNGPGSFTGVRVGVGTVKGLAESPLISVVAVSRLHVLAYIAAVSAAALDAHRREIFLRLGERENDARELLAGQEELAAFEPIPRVAVCEDTAAEMLASAWPATEIVRTHAPTAADALSLALPQIRAGEFADIATLDGHYLRRSDAEIFGEAAALPRS